MSLAPRPSRWPLRWPDAVLDLQDQVLEIDMPAYLVGGAVRDAMLSRPIKDIDLATPASGMKLARRIADRIGGAYFPLDSERDVGRVLLETPDGRLMIDVAKFRGGGLLEDLAERDFTLNAMAVDLHGDLSQLIDPLDGESDAINRVIRRCSPTAIENDPLRALRAVRQSLQLGAQIDRATLADVRAAVPRLQGVSPERIRDEFVRILSLADPTAALRVADRLGMLKLIVPEVEPLHGLALPAPHIFDAWNHTLAVVDHLAGIMATISPQRTDETAAQFSRGMVVVALDVFRSRLQDHLAHLWPDERPHRALLLLAALLHEADKTYGESHNAAQASAAATEARAEGLRLSNDERVRLVKTLQFHRLPLEMDDLSDLSLHRFWRKAGEAGVDACLLALADYLGTVGHYFDQDSWLVVLERARLILDAYYERYAQVVEPPVLVDGDALMEVLALKRGPLIGKLLTLIREAQVTGDVNNADEALQLAREHLKQRG